MTEPPMTGRPENPGSNLPRRPRFDVAHLPEAIMDDRSPVWVGNVLLVIIETVVFGILVSSLFYIRRNFDMWPPPLVSIPKADLHPLPGLLFSTTNLVLIILSLIPVLYTDRRAKAMDKTATKIGLSVSLAVISLIITLRFYEFGELRFRWDENAYAGITWLILGMHLLHLFIALGESILMTTWIFVKGLDYKHARDVRVTAVYWYWIVGTWIPLYLIIFIGPRL